MKLVIRSSSIAVAVLALALLVVLAGCGAKTGLGVQPPPPHDAGMDAPIDAFVEPDAGPPPDECIELPFEEPPRELFVSFLARIQSADVMFLVDTTGSMSEEINQIQAGLRETLIPGLAAEIPDVRFSVGYHADFPLGSYGSEGDVVFRLLQGSTNDLAAVQGAVNRIPNLNGADGPESQTEALYQSATGEGLGRFVPPTRCPPDTRGYPCFRAEGAPIILLFTDAAFHNGPGGAQPYGPDVSPRPHSYDEAVAGLRAIGAKVLGLFSGAGDMEALLHLQSIARDTGAVRPDGTPIVFDIGSDGSRLDRGVIDTVQTLVDEVPIDIDALVEDVPTDDFDATRLVMAIQAFSADPADGATNLGDRFANVRPGTRVTFRIALFNDILPPMMEAQSLLLRVILRGDGVLHLQTTIVQIVIPGIRGETCDDVDRPTR